MFFTANYISYPRKVDKSGNRAQVSGIRRGTPIWHLADEVSYPRAFLSPPDLSYFLDLLSWNGNFHTDRTSRQSAYWRTIFWWNKKVRPQCLYLSSDADYGGRCTPACLPTLANCQACGRTQADKPWTQRGTSSTGSYHICLGKMARTIQRGETAAIGLSRSV